MTRAPSPLLTLVDDYISSSVFTKLSPVTKRQYTGYLDAAVTHFGATSIEDIESRKFKGRIIKWQEGIARTSPARADLCVVALAQAFKHALKRGVLLHNPAANLYRLYEKQKMLAPWSSEDEATFLNDCDRVTSDIFHLAKYTGLRRTDLAAVTWGADQGDHLIWMTSKSRKRRTVIIPIVKEARAFLDALRSRQRALPFGTQAFMLVGSKGLPMKPLTLGNRIGRRCKALGLKPTLHRLRYNYASLIIQAGFDDEAVAGVMGWTIGDVKELKRIYVHRSIIVSAQIKQLEINRSPSFL